MKNHTTIKRILFIFIIGAAATSFSVVSFAQESVSTSTPTREQILDSINAQRAAAEKGIADQQAAAEAQAQIDAQVFADLASKNNATNQTQMLAQIEAMRGLVPNSTITALEQKYQLGIYAPKKVSPLVASTTVSVKTATSTADVSFVFLKNLKQGDRGADVMMLQKILNRDVSTQITSSGAGSPGNETDFFGALTKVAVIKFQNKYAAEILIPNGLTSGTGFVGLSTRVVLNSLAGGKTVTVNSLPPKLKISYCAPIFTVVHGTELTASENASVSCVVASTQANCEKIDMYSKSLDSFTAGDGISDCRWITQ